MNNLISFLLSRRMKQLYIAADIGFIIALIVSGTVTKEMLVKSFVEVNMFLACILPIAYLFKVYRRKRIRKIFEEEVELSVEEYEAEVARMEKAVVSPSKLKPAMQDLLRQASTKCVSCRSQLSLNYASVQMYPHEDGFEVLGQTGPQWIYVVCSNCNYQNSLVKLGVPKA